MENMKPTKLAVLIDADNTSASVAQYLFEEIAKYGIASVKRIYGDWSSHTLNGWRDILLKHALTPNMALVSKKHPRLSARLAIAFSTLRTWGNPKRTKPAQQSPTHRPPPTGT